VDLSLSGLPALVVGVGFVVVFSAPVWLAARLIGAASPTLLRSALSLVLGTLGAALAAVFGGPLALLLAPLAYLLSFKVVLGTSFLGAIVLGILALAGYAAMLHLLSSGLSFGPESVPGPGPASGAGRV
jgi:hypothetical protein